MGRIGLKKKISNVIISSEIKYIDLIDNLNNESKHFTLNGVY